MIVVPHGAQRLVDVPERLMVGSEARLVRRVVVIKILSAEEPAAGTTVAFGGGVEIMQMRAHLRNAKAAVLALRRQFIEPANHPRFLITGDDGGSGKNRHVSGR